MTEQQIEAVARALAGDMFDCLPAKYRTTPDRDAYIEEQWPNFTTEARAALAALEATPEYRRLVEDAGKWREVSKAAAKLAHEVKPTCKGGVIPGRPFTQEEAIQYENFLDEFFPGAARAGGGEG